MIILLLPFSHIYWKTQSFCLFSTQNEKSETYLMLYWHLLNLLTDQFTSKELDRREIQIIEEKLKAIIDIFVSKCWTDEYSYKKKWFGIFCYLYDLYLVFNKTLFSWAGMKKYFYNHFSNIFSNISYFIQKTDLNIIYIFQLTLSQLGSYW